MNHFQLTPSIRYESLMGAQPRGSFSQEESKHSFLLLHTVSALIHELIPNGEATLSVIAPLMRRHARTLQRELSAAGTDFRTLLDAARFEIAKNALEMGQSITDLAVDLGYSELSAFSRAFKRWSGVSPQHWQPSGKACNTVSQNIKPRMETVHQTTFFSSRRQFSGISAENKGLPA